MHWYINFIIFGPKTPEEFMINTLNYRLSNLNEYRFFSLKISEVKFSSKQETTVLQLNFGKTRVEVMSCWRNEMIGKFGG